MKSDLLPHEARPAVVWGQVGVMDAALLPVMTEGASQDRRGLASQSGSRHSMSATCGPRLPNAIGQHKC
jgi:hypothetical protein